jgi:hypothetical protein
MDESRFISALGSIADCKWILQGFYGVEWGTPPGHMHVHFVIQSKYAKKRIIDTLATALTLASTHINVKPVGTVNYLSHLKDYVSKEYQQNQTRLSALGVPSLSILTRMTPNDFEALG